MYLGLLGSYRGRADVSKVSAGLRAKGIEMTNSICIRILEFLCLGFSRWFADGST
jgi:hypothetical protein